MLNGYCGTKVKSLKKHIISIQFMKATKITSVKFVRNLLVHQEKKNFTSKGFMMTWEIKNATSSVNVLSQHGKWTNTWRKIITQKSQKEPNNWN